MNYSRNRRILTTLFFLILLLFSTAGLFAQGTSRWYLTGGLGATALRDFNTTFGDLQYSAVEKDASLNYKLDSKPSILVNGGAGLSGSFSEHSMLGWDIGLNVRSGGFKLTPELIDQQGRLSDFYQSVLPEFGKTKDFRYLALHLPASITYLPFEFVGFKMGADLYYQFSSNITNNDIPYGALGETMGFTTHYIPKYQHPFHIGAHVGVFAPVNDRLRLDLDFFTDLTPRLKVTPASPGLPVFNFREMGARLNTRYYLK